MSTKPLGPQDARIALANALLAAYHRGRSDQAAGTILNTSRAWLVETYGEDHEDAMKQWEKERAE